MREVLEAFLEELRAGRPAVLATIVRSSGSTPRTTGARMLVRGDATTLGTIGGGAFEALVTQDALDLLRETGPNPRVKRYRFTETGDDALGMACGGTAEVLLEAAETGPRLVIFGAGHVGAALARLAAGVGFRPVLVDDRPEACEAARQGGLEATLCDAEYRDGVPGLESSDFVAVVTRCHRTDRLALARTAGVRLRYVGLIGSKRKREVLFARLRNEDGLAESDIERVRCPIGLPIGGETPEEIAVSIVAELVRERRAECPPADDRRPPADGTSNR